MAQPEKAARKGRFFVPFRRTFGGGCNLPDGKMHPPFPRKGGETAQTLPPASLSELRQPFRNLSARRGM